MVHRPVVLRLLLGLILSVPSLMGPATPIEAQAVPRLSGTAACSVPALTVLPNATVTIFSGAAQLATAHANVSGAWSVPGSAPNSTYFVRYQAANGGTTTCDVPLATGADGSGVASTSDPCPQTERKNQTWIEAAPVQLKATSTISLTDSLCSFSQSRWYKVNVLPGQRVTAEIVTTSFDATLALFKDISQTAQDLKPPDGGSLSLNDVQNITASLQRTLAAPDATSPDATSPDATSPDATSPDATSPDATSPDATSPDFATPDATSPDATSPDATSPDLYSVAQTRSILAYSDKPGNAPELVRRHTWDNTGSFYIRVHGNNGAFDDTTPFSLRVTLEDRECTTTDGGRPALTSTPPSFRAQVATPRTLILTNTARFPASSDTAALLADLTTFAQRPEVGGLVVDLAGDGGLAQDYAQWDSPNFTDCVPAANIVVDQIHRVEELVRAQNPATLQYVVLAGGDHVIPFRRLPDEAGIGNEQDYSPAVLDSSASEATLKSGYFLSQDVFGSFNKISRLDHDFQTFDLPVGRLVEDVPDIQAQLAAYTAADGVIQPSSALVTGYDFLSDAAALQREDLAASALSVDSSLIQPGDAGPLAASAWHDTDVRGKLFGPDRWGVVALNAHFSGNTLLAADMTSRVKSDELASVNDQRFVNTLWLSMGCHSGYNIVDPDATPGTQPVDWAQAIASQGGWLVGGAGYQYGNSPFLKYSEVLLSGLAHELRYYDGQTAGPVSLGQALVNTKRNYVHQGMTGIDEKAVSELTLYGVPMLGVNLPAGRIARPPAPGLLRPTAGNSPGLSRVDLTPSYRLTGHDLPLVKVETGGTATATYFDATSGGGAPDVQTTPGQPVVPQVVTPVTAGGTVARSAILYSASYTDLTTSASGQGRLRPLIEMPATDVTPVRPAYAAGIFTPAQIIDLSAFNGQFVSIKPFQFLSDGQSVFGTGRRYDSVTARVYYSNRSDSSALAGPPIIYNTDLSVKSGQLVVDATVGGPTITAYGKPTPDIEEVLATFTADLAPTGAASVSDRHSYPPPTNLYGKWASIALKPGSVTTNKVGFRKHFTGTIPLGGTDPSLVRLMIQAVGGNGLASIASNTGATLQFTPQTATLANPKFGTQVKFQPDGGTYTANYKAPLDVSARLTNLRTGAPLGDHEVTFAFGQARMRATTDHATGVATARFTVEELPSGSAPPKVTVGFDEDAGFLASGDSRDVTIQKTPTVFVGNSVTIDYGKAADIATLFVQLPSGNEPLREVGVHLAFIDGRVLDTLTDGFGRVIFDTLDFQGVQPGSYPTTLTFAGNDRYLPAPPLTFTQTVAVGPGGNHSVSFNGINAFVEAPSAPELNVTGSWTVEAWFKDEDPHGFNHDFRQIILKGDQNSREIPFFILVGHNTIVAGLRTGGYDFPVAADLRFARADPKAWHHVAVTLTRDLKPISVLTMWLDGHVVSYGLAPAHTKVGNDLPVEIGRSGPVSDKFWLGKIDDVRIWNVARSSSQISASFNGELTTTPTGLVANWKFDEPLQSLRAYSAVGSHTGVLSTSGASFSTDVHP
jgi:hypothetical protein